MKLVVGLGNPGPKYERTRHNIGFMAVDAIVRRHGFGPFRSKFQGEIAEGSIGGERIYALKPQTYMNASGEAVGAAARFYKIPPEEIAVLYDEIDLAPGKLKVKRGGGAAGHNGIRSIDAAIGNDYWRVRLGVGLNNQGADFLPLGAGLQRLQRVLEHQLGDSLGLVAVRGELHPTEFFGVPEELTGPAAPGVNLGFHHRPTVSTGDLIESHGNFVRGFADNVPGNRGTKLGKQLFGLILVYFHGTLGNPDWGEYFCFICQRTNADCLVGKFTSFGQGF